LNVGAEIRIVFNLSLNKDQSWNATLDSPDQGAMVILLGEVSLTEDSIRIEAPVVNGEWHQAAMLQVPPRVIMQGMPGRPSTTC